MSATMFKALVGKELRENLKWAALVLFGMSAAFAYALPSAAALSFGQGAVISSLLDALEATTTIGGLLAGLLFGAAQTLVENRGDRWGFLAHRPAHRTTLFWGKVTAGILLYAIATGLPLAATLLWIASPGYLPVPFDGRIALPAIANLFGGLVFYFAGFLTGMRDARWYASRAMGIGAATAFLVMQGGLADEFWQAVAIGTAGLIVLGTAAWSTFVAGGQYDSQPPVGRLATGASIALGIALIGWLLVLVNIERFAERNFTPSSRFTQYTISGDGKVVKITREDGQIVEISDMDGRQREVSRDFIFNQLREGGVITAALTRVMAAPPGFRSSRRMYALVRSGNAGDPLSWHYVERFGLIAVSDNLSRRIIGWMGPDGFSPGEARPRPFERRLGEMSPYASDAPLLAFEDAVYRIDFDNRTIARIFQRNPGETILNAGQSRATPPVPDTPAQIEEFEVIATTQRVIVQLPDGSRVLETPLDQHAAGFSMLQVQRAMRAPGTPTFLRLERPGDREIRISEFNAAGVMVNSWAVPAPLQFDSRSPSQLAVVAAITPVVGQVVLAIARPDSLTDLRPPGSTASGQWMAAILASLVCAAAAFAMGRRHAFPPARLGTWVGITLLLGPLGFLLMLALIEWPARESCPACSRKRVVTRERCEHCGEPFAAPTQNGTEIFAPMPGVSVLRTP